MSFSEELRQEAEGIWERIFQHPFLRELREGTLPLEKFRFYLCQDYHYLAGFARAVALALARAPDVQRMELLARRLLTPIERPLHGRLFALVGVDQAEAEATPMAPTNVAYTDHLLAVANAGGVGETAAALLPCPWSYHEIGQRLAATGPIPHQIYQEWAGFYAAGFLAESVAAWRDLLDMAASEAGPAALKAMRQAFLRSSRYEYMFWDMAYRMEQWPL